MREFTQELKHKSRELGFVLSGITPAAAPARIGQFHDWLEAGYAGQMRYLLDRREAYQHPKFVLEGCRSILMLALPYSSQNAPFPPGDDTRGRIARYAHGSVDYHDVIHERLKRLKHWVQERHPHAAVRGVVDTAPLLEREVAAAAGLGWVGKNTLLLNRSWGSYFFLAALLTDLALTADTPTGKGFCGTCTACLDQCPTKAFPEPFVLDATKCISYLTIEHRDHIETHLQADLAGWIFGCDICQEVCPWNRKEKAHDPAFVPATESLDVLDLLRISEAEFRACFRRTPMWRSKRRGLVRNAILLVGQRKLRAAVDSLLVLTTDPEPVLRAAAAWAIARIQPPKWQTRLRQMLDAERDAAVSSRIHAVLEQASTKSISRVSED